MCILYAWLLFRAFRVALLTWGRSEWLPQSHRCSPDKYGWNESNTKTWCRTLVYDMFIFYSWRWDSPGDCPRAGDVFGWNEALIKHCWLLDLTMSWWFLVYEYGYFLLLTLGSPGDCPGSVMLTRRIWLKWGFDETLLTIRFNNIIMTPGIWLPRGQRCCFDEFGWNEIMIKHYRLLDLIISWWLLVYWYGYFLLLAPGQSWRLPRCQRSGHADLVKWTWYYSVDNHI